MTSEGITIAIDDVRRSVCDWRLAGFLAWEDIRQRYVRTLLGPMWIVLSTGVWFGAMGFVMANLFGQSPAEYFPFLTCGLLAWLLIASSINDSGDVLIKASALIKSYPIPLFTHYLRFVFRNYIVFCHNILIYCVVILVYPPELSMVMWLAIPGLLLNMAILMGLSVFLSLANLRYRDTHLGVASAMQVLPFVTPIFWDRGMLKDHRWLADINPLYHMVQIVRAPLLGQSPAIESWVITTCLAAGLIVGGIAMFTRYRHRIIFWV